MNKLHHGIMMGMLAGAMALAAGCQAPPPPPKPPAPVVWKVPESRSAQVTELAQRTRQLETSLGKLPGTTREDHRTITLEYLQNLTKILRLAQGTTLPPDFINRLAVIEGAQSALAQSHLPRARLQALENDAAHAALGCFQEIIDSHVSDDSSLPAMVEAARAKVEMMYQSDGAMHDIDATNGFQGLADIARQISNDLSAEFGGATTNP